MLTDVEAIDVQAGNVSVRDLASGRRYREGFDQHAGRAFRSYWLWLGVGVMVVWTAGVGAGVLIGPRLPPLPHVTLAGAALFIGMLMPRLRDRPSIVAALTAAALAPLIARFLPSAAILTGTLAGLVAGFLARNEGPS
jgi:predicted branched-subunit amino acid permease